MIAPLQDHHARVIGELDREIALLDRRLTVLKSWRMREQQELDEMRKRAEQRVALKARAALRLPLPKAKQSRHSRSSRVS
jgi:hypothetical protein